jgi:hypothetical protein
MDIGLIIGPTAIPTVIHGLMPTVVTRTIVAPVSVSRSR